MKRFEGKCIGGPRHGQRMDSDTPVIRLPKKIEMPISPPSYAPPRYEPIRPETYLWDTLHFHEGEISYWRHSSIKNSYDALKTIL